jgi:hypothetical protein
MGLDKTQTHAILLTMNIIPLNHTFQQKRLHSSKSHRPHAPLPAFDQQSEPKRDKIPPYVSITGFLSLKPKARISQRTEPTAQNPAIYLVRTFLIEAISLVVPVQAEGGTKVVR